MDQIYFPLAVRDCGLWGDILGRGVIGGSGRKSSAGEGGRVAFDDIGGELLGVDRDGLLESMRKSLFTVTPCETEVRAALVKLKLSWQRQTVFVKYVFPTGEPSAFE